MPKPDISQLRPSAYIEETRTFTDATNPGVEIPLTFRVRPDVARNMQRFDLRDKYVTDYVTGRDGGKPGIFKYNAERVPISERLVTIATTLALAEVCEPPDTPYTVEDWFGFSITMPTMVEEAYLWQQEMAQRAGVEAKND